MSEWEKVPEACDADDVTAQLKLVYSGPPTNGKPSFGDEDNMMYVPYNSNLAERRLKKELREHSKMSQAEDKGVQTTLKNSPSGVLRGLSSFSNAYTFHTLWLILSYMRIKDMLDGKMLVTYMALTLGTLVGLALGTSFPICGHYRSALFAPLTISSLAIVLYHSPWSSESAFQQVVLDNTFPVALFCALVGLGYGGKQILTFQLAVEPPEQAVAQMAKVGVCMLAGFVTPQLMAFSMAEVVFRFMIKGFSHHHQHHLMFQTLLGVGLASELFVFCSSLCSKPRRALPLRNGYSYASILSHSLRTGIVFIAFGAASFSLCSGYNYTLSHTLFVSEERNKLFLFRVQLAFNTVLLPVACLALWLVHRCRILKLFHFSLLFFAFTCALFSFGCLYLAVLYPQLVWLKLIFFTLVVLGWGLSFVSIKAWMGSIAPEGHKATFMAFCMAMEVLGVLSFWGTSVSFTAHLKPPTLLLAAAGLMSVATLINSYTEGATQEPGTVDEKERKRLLLEPDSDEDEEWQRPESSEGQMFSSLTDEGQAHPGSQPPALSTRSASTESLP